MKENFYCLGCGGQLRQYLVPTKYAAKREGRQMQKLMFSYTSWRRLDFARRMANFFTRMGGGLHEISEEEECGFCKRAFRIRKDVERHRDLLQGPDWMASVEPNHPASKLDRALGPIGMCKKCLNYWWNTKKVAASSPLEYLDALSL